MKNKYIIFLAVGSVLISTQTVLAVATDKQAVRDEKRVERDAMIDEKKAEINEKIEQKKEDITQKKVSKMCERVNRSVERVRTQAQKREQLATEKLENRQLQIQEHRVLLEQGLQERRFSRDQQRTQFYGEMMQRAQTDEQIAAVNTFQNTVENAVAVRRTAIDNAVQTMREGVDALAQERIMTVKELYAMYQEQEENALKNSENACSGDATEADLKNIAKDLNVELQAAREELKMNINDQKKISAEVQKLQQSRQMDTKQSVDEFKKVIAAAQVELKKAFGVGELSNMDSDESLQE